MKRQILLIMAAVSAITLSGCGKLQVFVDNHKDYALEPIERDALTEDTYYVKDGTKFYEPYAMTSTGDIMWGSQDVVMIPDLYKNEYLAYKSSKVTSITGLAVERYRDDGMTFGVYGLTLDDEGYLTCPVNNIKSDSSLAQMLAGKPGDDFKIETIDGVSASNITLTDHGVIQGINSETSVHFTFYVGTVYYEGDASCDTRVFEHWEDFSLNDNGLTKLGYMIVNIPEDWKSGYYAVDKGLFKYHDHEKSSCNGVNDDVSEAYYSEDQPATALNSDRYVVTLDKELTNIGFDVSYEAQKSDSDSTSSESAESDIRCIMISPSGQQYEVPCSEGEGKIEMKWAEKGKWIVSIYPKGTRINGINVYPIQNKETSIEEDKLFSVGADGDYEFDISYEGSGSIWGTIENVDTGESTEFNNTLTNDNNADSGLKKTFTVQAKNLAKGTYKVRIYHYGSETSIDDCRIKSMGTSNKTFQFGTSSKKKKK